jgi:hypothetical protein
MGSVFSRRVSRPEGRLGLRQGRIVAQARLVGKWKAAEMWADFRFSGKFAGILAKTHRCGMGGL